jgi:hypothetical protein
MLRKSMIALCAVASLGLLAPDVAVARGGGGGGGRGGGGGFGGHVGGGGFGGGSFSAARAGGPGFGAAAVRSGSFGNSFARTTAIGAAGVAGVAGSRWAGSRWAGVNPAFHPGFRHGFHHRRFFVAGVGGGFWPYYDDWYDYPYYYDGGCYIVQQRVHTRFGWRLVPVQVCG